MTFKPAERQAVADRGSPRFAGKILVVGDEVSLVKWLDPKPRGPEQYVSNEMLEPFGGEGKMKHEDDGEKSDAEVVGDDLDQQAVDEAETGGSTPRPDPDFQSFGSIKELIECYNDMVVVAINNGLKAAIVDNFESMEEGHLACERLHQSIKRAQEPRKEKTVKKSKAKKALKSVKKPAVKAAAKPVKAAKPKGNGHAKGEPRKGSKTEEIARLLQRKTGCTTADVLKATGWIAVSMPAMAKACNLKLSKVKEPGKPTRYFGE